MYSMVGHYMSPACGKRALGFETELSTKIETNEVGRYTKEIGKR